MPDLEQLFELLERVFNNSVAIWVSRILVLLFILFATLWLLHGIIDLIKKILPIFYKPEEKTRNQRRRRFAGYIKDEIEKLNKSEKWSDKRFTELEAEIEAEGEFKKSSFIPFFYRVKSGLRREKSLSKALEDSNARLILLSGDPGSGKSIAFRHIALKMTGFAEASRSNLTAIPLYFNLKNLEHQPDRIIDREMIMDFVIKNLNRIGDRDIGKFLEEEFEQGLREGTWLFLFDSFDEIPEVLGSKEVDETIQSYASAILDFLGGMNRCRGIIATRQFIGTQLKGYFGWTRFRISPLAPERQRELIGKSGIQSSQKNHLIGQLDVCTPDIRQMASNPLFLHLLINHISNNNPFPENAHIVFETFVDDRLNRDADRLQRKYGISSSQLREVAENVAFSMSADSTLGLSPTRYKLFQAMDLQGFELTGQVSLGLDALEDINLAYCPEGDHASGDTRSFTFVHRRFQEYFATAVVLRKTDKISPKELLGNPRWRETTVVLCQTQPLVKLVNIIQEIRRLLSANINQIYPSIEPMQNPSADADQSKFSILYPWPEGLLYLLSLIQDGFSSYKGSLPDDIRKMIGYIVLTACTEGTLPDRKAALEVAGVAPDQVLTDIIRVAIRHKSLFLNEAVYRQVGKLSSIPDDIGRWIINSLIARMAYYRLYPDRHEVEAFLARLPQSSRFIKIMRILMILPYIDISILFLVGLVFPIRLGNNLSFLTLGQPFYIILGSSFVTLFALLFIHSGFMSSAMFLGNSIRQGSHNQEVISDFNVMLRFFYIAYIFYSSGPKISSIAFGLMSSYVLLITPAMLYFSRTNLYSPRNSDWFLAPARLILLWIRDIPSFLKSSMISFKNDWRTNVFSSLLLLLVLLGFSLITWIGEKNSLVLGLLAIIFIGLFIGWFYWNLTRSANPYIRDRRNWRLWKRSRPRLMDEIEFTQYWKKFQTDLYKMRLVVDIGQRDALLATPKTEELLKNMILKLEHTTNRETISSIRLLDEMCLLLELIQNRLNN